MKKETEQTLPENPLPPVVEPNFGTWVIEDKEDEAFNIETKRYANGAISKRCKLTDGREAVAHLLKGKDRVMVQRIAAGDSSKVQDAIVALSTKIDGKPIVMEDLDGMWFPDYTRVQTMAASLNFI